MNMSKLKILSEHEWDEGAKAAAEQQPIKQLKHFPEMVGITPDTKKFLKGKSLKWMITQDHKKEVLSGFLKHPFKYGWRYIRSLFKKKSFVRKDDFYLYGL